MRLTFYADDFTGATDALESLTLGGARALLFVDPPSRDELARLPALDAVGVAGDSRTWSPLQMRARLPAVFGALRELGAPLCHYKVCSTFDSAPGVGNLAVAGEIGRAVLGGDWVPVVPGAPALGRWCVFGTLFARAGDGAVRRLDRHPIARHPVTPMGEAGVLEHLAALGGAPAALVPTHLADGSAEERLAGALASDPTFVAFDVADADDLAAAAGAVADAADRGEVGIVVGASGIAAAMPAQWGLRPIPPRPLPPADAVLVLSASASSITGAQIRAAVDAGWEEHALDTAAQPAEAVAARVRWSTGA